RREFRPYVDDGTARLGHDGITRVADRGAAAGGAIMTDIATTHQARVIVQLRELILRGELAPGERVGEAALAERLGVSRTAIRQALALLAQEGLLQAADTRGYFVRSFSAQEVLDAIDVRGVLEGLAARVVAERGAPRGLVRQLEDCLRDGDE